MAVVFIISTPPYIYYSPSKLSSSFAETGTVDLRISRLPPPAAVSMKNCSSRSVRCRISTVEEEGEDRFGAVPDEIVLKIMETVKDAKTLIRCTAVSKRLASLAATARSVSLKIHRPSPSVECFKLKHQPFNGYPQSFATQNSIHVTGSGNYTTSFRPFGMHWPRDPLDHRKIAEIVSLLNSFKEIRRLCIGFTRGEVPYRCNDVVKWKLEVSPDCWLGFKSCVVLERVGSEIRDELLMFRVGRVKKRVRWLAGLMRLFFEMRPVLGRIKRDRPTVKEISVGDGKGEIRCGVDLGSDTVSPKNKLLTMQSWFVPLVELSEPVRRAVEGPNRTANGVVVTVLEPYLKYQPDADVVADVVGPEIAKKIESSPSENIMDLTWVVNIGHC